MTYDIPSAIDQHSWDDATPDKSVMIADGPCVKVYVKDKGLFISDGPGGKRERMIDNAGDPTKRLIILSASGSVSLQAERWLADQGVVWAHMETAGKRVRLLASSGGFRNPKLVRRQAMVGQEMPDHDGLGIAINRELIKRKIEGQAYNAEYKLHNPEAAKKVSAWLDSLPFANDVEAIRAVEGNAAREYWQAWKGLTIKWTGNRPLKPRWQGFCERDSLSYAGKTNKAATDTVNAQLNYVYHIAEILCVHAIIAAGMEPTLGISHSDQDGRDSFALDVVEVMRPWVDEIVINRVLHKTYKKDMFSEHDRTINKVLVNGVIRCEPPLTLELASAVHGLASKLTPAITFLTNALSS